MNKQKILLFLYLFLCNILSFGQISNDKPKYTDWITLYDDPSILFKFQYRYRPTTCKNFNTTMWYQTRYTEPLKEVYADFKVNYVKCEGNGETGNESMGVWTFFKGKPKDDGWIYKSSSWVIGSRFTTFEIKRLTIKDEKKQNKTIQETPSIKQETNDFINGVSRKYNQNKYPAGTAQNREFDSYKNQLSRKLENYKNATTLESQENIKSEINQITNKLDALEKSYEESIANQEKLKAEEEQRQIENEKIRQQQLQNFENKKQADQQSKDLGIATTAALAGGIISMASMFDPAVNYPFNRFVLNFNLSLGYSNFPLVVNKSGIRNVANSSFTQSTAAVDGFASAELWFIRGKHFGIGGLGSGSFAVYSPTTGVEQTTATYYYGGRVLGGLNSLKIVGEYGMGGRAGAYNRDEDIATNTVGASGVTTGSENHTFTRFGGGLLIEWNNKINSDDVEKSILLMTYFDRLNFLPASYQSIPVFKIGIKAYVDISLEYSPNYPITGFGSYKMEKITNQSLFAVRVGYTVSLIKSKQRKSKQ
jgi:hypothetical protein